MDDEMRKEALDNMDLEAQPKQTEQARQSEQADGLPDPLEQQDQQWRPTDPMPDPREGLQHSAETNERDDNTKESSGTSAEAESEIEHPTDVVLGG